MNTDSVLDEDVWDRLSAIIMAAHELDRDTFVALGWSFNNEVKLPGKQRAGLYVWYLLRNALGGKVGGRVPTDDELARISHDYVARFSSLVMADRPILEDTFRKVFERTPLTKEIGPGDLLVLAPAALGVLYSDPGTELNRMKPHLNSWWQKHATSTTARVCSDDHRRESNAGCGAERVVTPAERRRRSHGCGQLRPAARFPPTKGGRVWCIGRGMQAY